MQLVESELQVKQKHVVRAMRDGKCVNCERHLDHERAAIGTVDELEDNHEPSEQQTDLSPQNNEKKKANLHRLLQLTTLEAQLQAVRQENGDLAFDLEVATKEVNELRDDVILSKRKIELRERYLMDKEAQMVEWEARLDEAEQQLLRDREEVMAKLDDSIVSHVSIPDSEYQSNTKHTHRNSAMKKEELVVGIEAREKIVAGQMQQLEAQNALLQKSLSDKLDRIKSEEVKLASRIHELKSAEKNVEQRRSQVE